MMNQITNASKFEPFYVGVPHQKPPFIVMFRDIEALPPCEEDGDRFFSGDHDLHTFHVVETVGDALVLIASGQGDRTRHQAYPIAVMVEQQLVDMGVVTEEA